MKPLEHALREVRRKGRKALVPYVMGGMSPNWTEYVHAAIAAGADAVEIGIPFSDPLMDGVVIQEAGHVALMGGATFASVCHELSKESFGVPLIAMTYYNLIHHAGEQRAAGQLGAAGVIGCILPDLPLEESSSWRTHCDEAAIANVLMVAPSTPVQRLSTIAATAEGFCYASARMAVTGASNDTGDGGRVAAAVRAASDIPVFIGIGITTPAQAQVVVTQSDGAIVGSALIEKILKGATPGAVQEFLEEFRSAIDEHH